MTDFTIILRSLRARLFSTLTTIATVAVAVALILVLLTMRNSGQRAFERGSGDMHLLVSGDASPLVAVLNGVFYANPPRRPIPWDRFEQLQSQAPWAYCVPTAIGDSFRGMPVVATTPDMFTRFKPVIGEPWTLADGRFLASDFEVVVGSSAARVAGLHVGDTVFLTHGFPRGGGPMVGDVRHEHDEHAAAEDTRDEHDEHGEAEHAEGAAHLHRQFGCKVVGILAPTYSPHDRALFVSLNTSWILHAHDRREREGVFKDPATPHTTTAADLTGADRKITGAYLRLEGRENGDAPANLPQVFDMLRKDTSLTVAQPSQEVATLFRIVDSINRLFLAVAGVVMVASAVSIMLALYNSMEQRRRQIAVMRVLGASAGRIFALVLTESAVIGLCGAALGAALAFGGAYGARGILRDRLGLIIEPAFSPQDILGVVLVTLVLACLAGLVPAAVGYRVSVARSLRTIA
ncbi:MAG: ABC transporter permease [Phycisphaerales bacterium]